MRRPLVVLLATLVACLALAAAVSAGSQGEYRVQQDVLLATVKDWKGRTTQLGVDLYVPRRAKAPLLLWLHGGGFFSGDRRDDEALGYALAARGYAVASIDYRLRAPGVIEKEGIAAAERDAEEDVLRAVGWARRNAATLRIDPTRIAIGGHSAGALTALALAARGSTGFRPCLAVSVSGGIETTKVRSGMPPVAFFHSPFDPTVRPGFAAAAMQEMRSRGVRTWWTDLTRVGHALDDTAWQGTVAPRLAKILAATC